MLAPWSSLFGLDVGVDHSHTAVAKGSEQAGRPATAAHAEGQRLAAKIEQRRKRLIRLAGEFLSEPSGLRYQHG